eukprot:264456-Chlamydomonas_euryale.AAC.9
MSNPPALDEATQTFAVAYRLTQGNARQRQHLWVGNLGRYSSCMSTSPSCRIAARLAAGLARRRGGRRASGWRTAAAARADGAQRQARLCLLARLPSGRGLHCGIVHAFQFPPPSSQP